MDLRFTDASWWTRKAIPRDIDTLRKALPAYNGSHEKWVALADAAEIVHDMIDCALKGDAGCGRFLGTLTAASEKNRHKFCEANYYFDKTYSEYMSARPATRKHSALRQLIEEVIGRANLGRSYFVDTGERLGLVADIAVDDLRSLPEFGQNQIEKFEIGRALASSDQ